MQHFRSSLTRLKGLMEQKLPDGNDIYGYSGISKQSLLATIETAYTLSHAINDPDETRFEVISLKRAGSALYKTLKDFLEANTGETERRTGFEIDGGKVESDKVQ